MPVKEEEEDCKRNLLEICAVRINQAAYGGNFLLTFQDKENSSDRFSRKVGKELPSYAA
jgi:hypothetical protein